MDAKMTATDINTHFKHYKNEPKIAAYLGYTDVMEFRKFRFSAIVLEWYLCYHKYCQARSIKIPLALLRDLPDLPSAFPKSTKDLLNYYPIVEPETRDNRKDNTQNRDYIYAGILYNLANLIDQARASYVFDPAVHKDISNRFEKAFDKITDFKIPAFDPSKIQFPILGPRPEFEEHVLERYSRVNAVIKSLQVVLAPTKWRETFNTKFPFKSTKIAADMIPTWMRSPDTKDVQAVTTTFSGPNARPKKKFFLTLDMETRTKANLELKKHIENHVEYNSLRMPEIMTEADRDPRDYPLGEMWRDTIRRQLCFSELQVDFLTIKLNPKFPAFGGALLVYDLMTPAARAPWHDVLSYISEEIPEFTFTYTLHVVDDMEFDYEYSGPLLAIQEDIELTADKDIAAKPAADSKQPDIQQPDIQQPDIQQPTIQNNGKTANESSISKLNQLLEKFLSESEYIARKKPIPEALFMQDQRQEMMEYHDNHDAFCPEGLLKWQHFVLEKLCGQMPRAVKESAHMKLPKDLRTQLMDAQTDAEIALISAEVCTFSNWFEDI